MAGDPAKVASEAYKVLVENDHVRVLEYRAGPGIKTAMHGHPDLVAVAISRAKVKFTFPDGQTAEAELSDGEAGFFEATEHITENVGAGDAHIVLVELK